MSDRTELVYSAGLPAGDPGTHVLIIGVGRYTYGKDTELRSIVAGDLGQLSSPPISARAVADWFIGHFHHPEKPLASVALLLSQDEDQAYLPPGPDGAEPVLTPRATLANVKAAARRWTERLKANKDNMAVFYFCGHGLSMGDNASLLLEDFGDPENAYDGAIEFSELLATMKNCPAGQQAFFADCCRTNADQLYRHEDRIGIRIVSMVSPDGRRPPAPRQFVLFPTIDGEQAFGIAKEKSIFTRAMLEAMSFAAADDSSGLWMTNTGSLLRRIDELVALRLPPERRNRSRPNALNASAFDFNEIAEPSHARSLVKLSDFTLSNQVTFECASLDDPVNSPNQQGGFISGENFCIFNLKEGQWRFSGVHGGSPAPRSISPEERKVRLPVTYVTLNVQP